MTVEADMEKVREALEEASVDAQVAFDRIQAQLEAAQQGWNAALESAQQETELWKAAVAERDAAVEALDEESKNVNYWMTRHRTACEQLALAKEQTYCQICGAVLAEQEKEQP